MQLNVCVYKYIYVKQEKPVSCGELTLIEILFGTLSWFGLIDVNFGISSNYAFRTSDT